MAHLDVLDSAYQGQLVQLAHLLKEYGKTIDAQDGPAYHPTRRKPIV